MNDFEKTIKLCEEHGFNERITREILWNTAYQLGRSRWHWGPMWWVDWKCEMKSRINSLWRKII